MRSARILLLLLIAGVSSCITPGEIPVLQPVNWTVFGLMGEGNAPLIFIYTLNEEEASLVYYEDAAIRVTNSDNGVTTDLIPITEESGGLFMASQEFPFDVDSSGQITYYTTPLGVPLPAGNYTIDLSIEGEEGTAEVTFPSAVEFQSVEIITEDNVDRLVMEIPQTPVGYYKWEILIDQVLPVQVPLTYDSVSGEPATFETLNVPLYQQITANRYITPAVIAEDGTEFRYKLTENLPDFPYTDETYQLLVRLRHYSQDLEDYFESIRAQNGGTLFDPFIEPNIIRSNIDGMFGVIGTYSYSQGVQLEYTP